jgi:hypothetical protein
MKGFRFAYELMANNRSSTPSLQTSQLLSSYVQQGKNCRKRVSGSEREREREREREKKNGSILSSLLVVHLNTPKVE